MTTVPPAFVGASLAEIDTPALVVDLDVMERNITRMAEFAAASGVKVRPHAKTHRCPAVALRQIAAGAVGQCAQTVGEAEALVAGGIGDVIVTNEILSPSKLARLAALGASATIGLLCDSPDGVEAASRAATDAGTTLGILVEIEVGMGRCGIAPGEPSASLARAIADAPGLTFRGLQAYNGSAQHLTRLDDRRDAVGRAADAVRSTLAALDAEGLAAEIVGGAGTGTYRYEAATGLWTELQVGSYVFMDREYSGLETAGGASVPDFAQSLFVLAEVISTPAPGRAIANAGLKSMSAEQGRPGLRGRPGADVTGISDEHSRIVTVDEGQSLSLRDRVWLVPSHCDPTVNLHDWIVATRNGHVEDVWPVSARGASR